MCLVIKVSPCEVILFTAESEMLVSVATTSGTSSGEGCVEEEPGK